MKTDAVTGEHYPCQSVATAADGEIEGDIRGRVARNHEDYQHVCQTAETESRGTT